MKSVDRSPRYKSMEILAFLKGAFTNYFYKKRWVGSPKMTIFIR
jgi:hypothetical protein